MQNLYDEVGSLDKRCYDEFGLTEDILMEHAANGMAEFIRAKFPKGSSVVVVCGSGNNGADGLVCARLLHVEYDVSILYAKEPSSPMALLQKKRVDSLDIPTCRELKECDVLVDAIVGTGFSGEFDEAITTLLEQMNSSKAYKIACDVPSGYKFFADTTLTMGAIKKAMFLDPHKDYVGDIKVLNLGVSRDVYEKPSTCKLLDIDDMELPFRDKKDSHKGSFGHLAITCGEKQGASILSASAALRFGSGLVTLVGYKENNIPPSLMSSHLLPRNTTAIALGMGLGNEFSDSELKDLLNNDLPLVADADVFHSEIILELIKRKNVVLTPHAKEFVSLLKLTNLADINIAELQENRFKYVELFSKTYPDVTLLLKGANVIISLNEQMFINPHGSSKLAKGGSGDVLSGLIGALLAQGYSVFDSAISASLAHTKLALDYKGADFSLTPDDLIDGICYL